MRKISFLASVLFVTLSMSSCDKIRSALAPDNMKNSPQTDGLKNMAQPSRAEEIKNNLDQEPNDRPSKASQLKLIGDDISASGELTPSDIDCWLLRGKSGTVANVTVTSEKEADFLVSVYGSDLGRPTFAIDNQYLGAKPSSEIIPNLKLLPEGTPICVRARNTKNIPYIISLHRLPISPTPEEEPNDKVSDAQILQIPAQVLATVKQSGDLDNFRLAAFKNAVLKIQAPNTTLDVTVTLDGKTVWKSLVQPKTLASCALDASQRNYLLKIESVGPVREIIPYQIQLEDRQDGTLELEPNDTEQSSQKIDTSQTNLNFSFKDAQDVDCFEITPLFNGPKTLLNLFVDSEASFGARLIHQGKSVTPLKRDKGITLCQYPITLPAQVGLCLSLNSDNVAPLPTSYNLKMKTLDPEKFETEPNDALSNANPLIPGTVLSGYIFPKTDMDIYTVMIPRDLENREQLGHLSIETSPGYIAGLQMKLLDSGQGEVARVQSTEFSNSLQLKVDVPSGQYYVILTGTGDDCIKPYTLKATLALSPILRQPGTQTITNDSPIPTENKDVPTTQPGTNEKKDDSINQLLDLAAPSAQK